MLPEGLTDIEDMAFSECWSLVDDQGFVIVNDMLFGYYGQEVQVTVPSNVKRLSSHAFYRQHDLTHVTVPDGVTYIGNNAFAECENLKSVSLPSCITYMGERTFYQCGLLESVSLPGRITEIADALFVACRSLKNVSLPANIKRIGSSAFSGCTSLESITFAGNEPAVGNYAFYSCPATAKVFIPPSAPCWPAPGNAWNGMTLHYAEPSGQVAYAGSLPEFTAFSPEAAVKISPSARMLFTEADAADIASKITYFPANSDQGVRFFKGKGVLDGTGAIVVTAQLDLEAMEFAKTSKEVCDKVASANGDSAAITLTTAKPGFWYGVAVADSLAALENADAADAACATGDGVELTVPKPAGGTAFFKVLVNTQEIPVR